MSFPILTTQELTDIFKANFEGELSQDVPPVDIAFLKVLSVIEAMVASALYKYAADRAKANLALTASEDDLELIGQEYDVIRKQAESAVFTATLPGTNGTVIPATVSFIGDSNGARYFPDASSTVAGGVATLSVTAEVAGVGGNLNVAETMSISVQIAGAETVATITTIDNTGTDIEDIEVYRARVLSAIRVSTGGSNAADYKTWAEEVAGVKRAFPYSGLPYGDPGTSFPGDRTVYVEATTAIDPDGIPTTAILDDVRDSLNTDPTTGESRPCLGLTDDTLYVEAISRLEFTVTVTNIAIQSDLLAQVQSDIESAVESYFLSLAPFVIGIDFQEDRKDTITAMTVAEIVQNVLTSAGGTCESVTVYDSAPAIVTSYTLNPGELSKSGGVTFA